MIDFILGILKLFWYGTVLMSKKHSNIAYYYAITPIIIIVLAFVDDDFGFYIPFMIFWMVLSALILGIVYFIIHILPGRRLREFFNKAFKDINLKNEKNVPVFLSKEEISNYVTVYLFKCYCPLKMWRAKKDALEMYLETKIVDIKQSEHNKSIIQLFTENEPLQDVIPWNNDYISENNVLNIGMGYFGMIGMDLEQYPHAFIAGETGSGKSNILKCFIHQAIHKGYEVLLIDFKRGVSFADFSSQITIHYEYKDVMKVLRDMVAEVTARLDKFRAVKVDNLVDYNQVIGDGDSLNKKIIFIDELAELLKTRDRETTNILNDSIETLTRLSRAVGIHLIMAIQRPDSTVISGQIKNNVGYRICGHFVDREPSRIMLGNDMANAIQNIKGRFIVKDNDMHEVQGFYFRIPPEVVAQDSTQPGFNPFMDAGTDTTVTEPEQPKEKPASTDEFDFDFSEYKK